MSHQWQDDQMPPPPAVPAAEDDAPARPGRVVVCTFATPEYAGSAALLRHTALGVGGADAVVVYTPDHEDVLPLYEQFPELLAGDTRAHGFWSWKPWCILQTLQRTRPGDVVVYCDAAMMVEAPLAPLAAAVRDVLLFRLGNWATKDYRNERWTKRDAFALMGMADTEHREAVQLTAAVQVYRHTRAAMEFVESYVSWCCKRSVIDDSHAIANYPGFQAHRHDQSVLSLLAVGKWAVVRVARDPTQWGADDPRGADGVEEVADAPLFMHHRQRRRPIKVAVITPTVGGPHLAECVASVQAQELPNVVHYVVVDGPQHEAAVREALAPFAHRGPLHVCVLPHNVGGDGWNGHRVYGSFPFLVDCDYVSFLDEDNAYDPDHLLGLVRAVVSKRGARWAHSLRRIVDRDGGAVCADNCESLGGIAHTVCGAGDRLVDTNCYLMQRDLAIEMGPVWNARFRDPAGKMEADRAMARVLLVTGGGAEGGEVPHAVYRRHSVRYRVSSTARSVGPDFFTGGNARTGHDFARYEDLYVFHFSPATTARYLGLRRLRDRSYALDEWQMTLLRGLDGLADGLADGLPDGTVPKRYNLLDGYACADAIPRGARVLVTMCMPDQVPWQFLASRPDLWRVAYTLESPNIRHAAQWSPDMLGSKHFDAVLTYWKPLLADPRVNTLFCPHNTHHLDFTDPADVAQLRDNRGGGTSCAMVLERRDLSGAYTVPGLPATQLFCLDPLREVLVRDLRDVTVFGAGWDAAAARNPGIKLGHALHRSRDPRHAVDILQDYTFAVIVENTDAEGYASEKLYDALLAGCVPLYYGSVPPELGIPEGPDAGVYLDLRALLGPPTGAETMSHRLQAFLDGLSGERVAAWKRRVADLRAGVLAKVDTASFAAVVNRALAQQPPPSP